MRIRAPCWILGGIVVLGQIGCEQSGIEEHRASDGAEQSAPSGDEGEASQPLSEAANGPASDQGSDLPLVLPEGWTLDPEPRRMRLATFMAPDESGPIEVAVTRFGGRVGGVLANINRWRGQLGLEPVAESDLESIITRFSAPGFDGYETRIESDSGVLLASAVYDESIDQTWFVRATVADPSVADRIERDLFGMARSITSSGGAGGGGGG